MESRKIKSVSLFNLPPNGMELVKASPIQDFVYPPLGVMQIGCCVQTAFPDIKLNLIDLALQDYSRCETENAYREAIMTQLRENVLNPDLCCVSLMFTASHSFAIILLECLREAYPDALIVCGGVHATANVQRLLEMQPAVDCVISGESDEVLVQWIGTLRDGSGKAVPGVHLPGMVRLTPSGEVEVAPRVENFDIDFVLRSKLFDLDYYLERGKSFTFSRRREAGRMFPIMASRGCPCQCSFCAANLIQGRMPRWRSLDNIRGEIQWLYDRHRVSQILIFDDNFTPKPAALEFFTFLRDLSLPGLEVKIQNMSVNHTDFDIIDCIAALNIADIAFAVESGDAEIQKKIRKNCDLVKVGQLVKYARSKGIITRCLYVLGFPGETIEQMRKTIEFARSVDSDWSTFSIAFPLPGTAMYDEFVSMGCFKDDPKEWGVTNFTTRSFDTPEASAEEVETIANTANLEMNFINNRLLMNGKYEEARAFFERFVVSMPFHVFAYDCLRRACELSGDDTSASRWERHMLGLMTTNRRSQWYKPYLWLLGADIRHKLESALPGA